MQNATRRRLLGLLALLGAGSALAQAPAPAPVRVYLVPLDDFSEYLAGNMAKQLQQELGIKVSPSMRLAPLALQNLPETNQVAGEDVLTLATEASARLPNLDASTYRVFLTMRDINAKAGDFRFQFSMHQPELNSSVVSMARLLEPGASRYHPTERAAQRMFKMVKRAVGELHLGWRRSTDPNDLMYAPLMGVVDIDMLGLDHRLVGGETTPVAANAGSAAPHRVQ
ncbi:hypothetical protein [Massilia sp. ST3]|uniref:hypothetical protein n=1 Tax=Massilia sp. ST3 TaxID=2824903 RepID=UPI001B846203|nr:hypothetical protein [Massilia sp. ST3]MBQ5946487.1 hypothetical protein [Massilia sp. ST3]